MRAIHVRGSSVEAHAAKLVERFGVHRPYMAATGRMNANPYFSAPYNHGASIGAEIDYTHSEG